MTTHPAGWYADPLGRFDQRYWDGSRWTEHVVTAGMQQVDPDGVSAAATMETTTVRSDPGDPNAQVDPAAERPTGIWPLLDSMGADARLRPRPSLRLALAGGGGLVMAIGLAALIIGDDGEQSMATVAGLVLVAIGLAARLAPTTAAIDELRSAAVSFGAAGIVLFGIGAAGDSAGEAWSLLLVGALFLAAWAVKGFRGRPLMLGLGALFLVSALGAATASSDEYCYYDEYFEEEVCEYPSSDLGLPDEVGSAIGDQSSVFLLAAAGLLGLVWVLDRRGYHGVATPLTVSALLSAFIGTGQSFVDLGTTGPAILILVVGVLVCLVGSHGARRATTWWGAALAVIGAVAFWVAAMTPEGAGDIGTTLLVAGGCLVVAPLVVRRVRAASQEAPPNQWQPPTA